MKKNSYRWPTKIKKFGILNPILKFFIALYENEIPWQVEVNDEDTLVNHIKTVMLPNFIEQLEFPNQIESRKKHLYITKKHISLSYLERILIVENNDPDIKKISKIKDNKGNDYALEALIILINKRKKLAFEKWVKLLEGNYSHDPAFRFILMRLIFESSGYGTRQPLKDPVKDIISLMYRGMKLGALLPSHSIIDAYNFNFNFKDGWIYIDSGIENLHKLMRYANNSGWCIGQKKHATLYLRSNCFFILYSNNEPVVALRMSKGLDKVIECRGRHNSVPEKWFSKIWLFLKTLNSDISYCNHIESVIDASLKSILAESFLKGEREEFIDVNKIENMSTYDYMFDFIVNNLTGIFQDEVIPNEIRSRNDFEYIREISWSDAVDKQPILSLVVPDDLKDKYINNSNKLNIDSEVKLYTQNWIERLRKNPTKFSYTYYMYGRRVCSRMPSALFYNEEIINTLKRSWMPSNIGKANYEIPAVQLSILKAFRGQNFVNMINSTDYKKRSIIRLVYREIKNAFDRKKHLNLPIHEKIQDELNYLNRAYLLCGD
jgi:hypothetical protein